MKIENFDTGLKGQKDIKNIIKKDNTKITINNNNTPVNLSNIIWSAILTIPIGPANWLVIVLSLNDLIKNEKDW